MRAREHNTSVHAHAHKNMGAHEFGYEGGENEGATEVGGGGREDERGARERGGETASSNIRNGGDPAGGETTFNES